MATNTATSFTNHTAPGSGSTAGPYAISFDYLDQSDVDVTVNGTLQALGVSYTFTSGTQITFTSGNEPANGAAIVIRRDTNISAKKVDFQDGSVLTETDLDTNTEQILFGLQEFTDKINGIEDGATGDQTPAEILAAIVQVDGAGSGLDADKLDGQEGSYYLDQANLNFGNIRIGVTDTNEIDTSSGNLTIDSAGGTTTIDDHVTITGNLTVNGTSDATTFAGHSIDKFWRTDKTTILHNGSSTTFGKVNNSNVSHALSVAKDYTFEVGKYVNEGVAGGAFGNFHITPMLQMQHLIDYTRVTKIGGTYSTSNGDEFGHINLGTGSYSGLSGNDSTLTNTEIKHSHLIFNARKGFPVGGGGYASNTGPNDPNGFQPVLVLSGQKGAMFTHPDNTSYTYTVGTTSSGLPQLARGAYTQGVQSLGDPYNWGDSGYKTAAEACALLEAAIDFQIILGGARAKNKFEIGSSSVAGTLSLSGQDVTATGNELNVLDGFTGSTSELNKLDGLTASTTELNLLANKTVVTSIAGNATDNQLPSAQAVNERIVELVTEVGGFVPIANETSFPTTNPDVNDGAGTIVSIKALANNLTSNGSGVATITDGAGTGVTVTINGMANNDTIEAGKGILLETTTTLHTYNFHRETIDPAGITTADTLVSNFNERYYGPLSSNPATKPSGADRQDGDLYFNTSDNKMKVYNGTHASGTWDDVATPGNFFINTLSTSSGSGGNQSAFNGTATRFTLSNPPLTAQQLLVSVNGVIQKPNSGTSPSEGFAIDGADIIFAAPPALNAPFFIITIGSSVSIGTPSDSTVTTVKLDDGAVTDAKVSSSAAILGTKISPDFGAQDITTTGNASAAALNLTDNSPSLIFTDSAANSDFRIRVQSGVLKLRDDTNSADRLTIASNGTVGVNGNLDVGAGIDVTGNITVTGLAQFANTINLTHASAGQNYIYFNEDLQFAKNGTGTRLKIASNGTATILNSSGNTMLELQRTDVNTTGAVGTINFTASDGHSVASIGTLGDGDNEGADIVFRTTTAAASSDPFNAATPVNMTLDSYGRLLLGTTTAANSGADDLIIEETGHSVGITLRTSTTANGNIYFSDGTSGADEFRGFIQYLHATNKFNIGTNATDRVTIDANGHINILDGNLAVASGHGIDFSAVSDGSRSVDSNLLADYEEGTWTPTSNIGPITVNTAHYAKVGSIVTVQAYITFPAMSGSSGVNIASFPYTTTTPNDYHSCAVQSNANAGYQILGQFSNSTLTLMAPNGGGLSVNTMSSKYILFSITYQVH
tara:strand:+ start:5611 stop:9456 length:3846 start_codon:yes stop_codon:yes gene_type:complete